VEEVSLRMRAEAKAASPLAILLTLALIMPAITVVVPALAQEQSSPAPTPLQYPVDEKQRAELTIRSAQIALFKAESFINYTKSALSKANATELAKEALDSATALLNNAKALLEEAKAYFDQGAYENATLKAMEAMRLCREAYRTLHESLEKKGLVKPERPEVPEVQGRGILVAVNRSLERVERLEALIKGLKAVLPQIEGNLTKAKELLNAAEIQQLLIAGNVSEVAKRLAEAEKLIGQAYGLLHSTAKAKVAERIEKYKSKVLERLEELGKAVNATALSKALQGLGLRNIEELKKLVEDRVSEAKKDAKAGIDKALQKLKEVRDKLEELRKSLPRPPMPVPPITPPVKPPIEILPTPTPTPPMPAPPKYEAKLSVKAEATREGNYAIVKVVVENTGNVTILFSNAALNLVIEKNVDGKWVFYCSPISAQVITKLGPRETKALDLRIKAEPGLYRAVVKGLAEGTMQPIMAFAEFTIT
jgi:tetratricopeptide (TPR) repeat protein